MHPRQIENRRDISHQMIVRNDIIEMELIEQLALITLQPPIIAKPRRCTCCGDGSSVRSRRQQTFTTKSANSSRIGPDCATYRLLTAYPRTFLDVGPAPNP